MAFKLTTERLLLRPFQLADAEGFFAMNADPEVICYTGDSPFASVAEARQFIKNYDHYDLHGYGRWTLERLLDGVYLGFCGLKYHPVTQEVDLGFRVPRLFWGKGYATEAATACLVYGFSELGLKRIIGRVDKANAASIRVLEKIGMTFHSDIDFEGVPGFLFEISTNANDEPFQVASFWVK